MTTDLVITNSLIKQFKSCPNATKYKHIELLTPKMQRSKPLKRGIWFHELLEARYKGESVQKVHDANCIKFEQLYDEEKEALGDLPKEMYDLYRSYMWYYQNDTSWKIHEVEIKIEAELPNGMQGQGKADMLVEDQHGDLWAVDHKTHLTLPTWDYRLLDPQNPYYTWLFRKCGIPVRGFIWNYIVPKAPMPLRFKLNGGLSKTLPAVTDYPTVARMWPRVLHPYLDLEIQDMMTRLKKIRYDHETPQVHPLFRRDFIEHEPETIDNFISDICATAERYETWLQQTALGYPVERTVTRQCEWCEYRRLCIAELTGQNADGVRHREFTKHDPFAYYEVESVGDQTMQGL